LGDAALSVAYKYMKATGGASGTSEVSEASGATRRTGAWGGDSVFIISCIDSQEWPEILDRFVPIQLYSIFIDSFIFLIPKQAVPQVPCFKRQLR